VDQGAAKESRTVMESSSPTEMTPLSRAAWHELLARSVQTPELEPPVRRRCRRYGVHMGSWCILYLSGERPAELRVKLLNAALDGVMVLSREAVPEEIPALLVLTADEDDEHRLIGEIVHCTSTVGGYKVGVRLQFPASMDDAR
jgi:hypothetical protein